MTDRTQPEAVADCIFRLRGLRHVDRHEVAHAMESMVARIADLEAQLEAIGAGGVSGPLMGIAAPPTAQAEGWRPISTAPRDGTEVLADTSGLGRVVVYWDDEESQWGTGLGYLDRGAPTHWMPLPPSPTSAEGVEHG